ncbi:LANO_0E04016g1_1 [Lachancea nothofagi CBS 11611]|uniref:LANO_0E04016g1_1 n=1 Tax=Lachancea nothofagi CBS 11611 TaxID=1266666 RepID=A0A1G4JRP1_9SACH|nr:LANO_0E04016g1_1 [Lachancea nothofagi CBS 11611]
MKWHRVLHRTLVSGAKCFNKPEKDAGYLSRRLAQLKEENCVDQADPLSKLIRNEQLDVLHEELRKKTFEHQYRREIEVSKFGDHLSKNAQETAMSRPWFGDEHFTDTSLRMLMDGLKDKGTNKVIAVDNIAFKSKTNTTKHARGRTRDRLEAAQDNVINYKIDRDKKSIDEKEASEFRALYAEKFTPVGSLEKLRSLADFRIEESMKKGEFKSAHKLHGSKLSTSQPAPYVERTEHHLNDIMARQKVTPPWIDKQSSVNCDIQRLRAAFAESYHQELVSEMHARHMFNITTRDNTEARLELAATGLMKSAFTKWKTGYSNVAKAKINTLNNSMRSYNLQAPLSTQKLYLLVDREFKRVFESTDVVKVFQDEMALRQRAKEEYDDAKKALRHGSLKWIKSWRLW